MDDEERLEDNRHVGLAELTSEARAEVWDGRIIGLGEGNDRAEGQTEGVQSASRARGAGRRGTHSRYCKSKVQLNQLMLYSSR